MNWNELEQTKCVKDNDKKKFMDNEKEKKKWNKINKINI